jgi:hypothetical protein
MTLASMMSATPFSLIVDLSKMLTRKSFTTVPGASTQLIVGVPLASVVMVTSVGNGNGVVGMTETFGSATVTDPLELVNLACQVPLRRAVLKPTEVWQEFGCAVDGPHGRTEVVNDPVPVFDVKIPWTVVPADPPCTEPLAASPFTPSA